jgi:hypothetical protein
MKNCLISLLILFCACNDTSSSSPPLSEYDSIKRRQEITEQVGKTLQDARHKASDRRKSISDSLCPVKIIKARIVEDDYGSKSVKVTLRNTTGETVDGIKVKWSLYNNFDEEVNEAYSGGMAQEKIKSGKTATYEWEIYRTSATRVEAYILSVHTASGGKWSIE